MAKTYLDAQCDFLLHVRDKIVQNSVALKMLVDKLQKQIAAMRHDLKNVGCENCAHQDCGNTEEPCKSCGIRELKWEWEGSGNGGAENGDRSDSD